MQAVVLAGGLGTRLGSLTAQVPKPMVTVAGVPYLQHQLHLLREQAIGDVLLLTGYLGHLVEEYFGDGSRFGLRIQYSRETTPLGTGGALRLAAPLLAERFLVIYGDSYLPIDYRDVLATLHRSSAVGLVTVFDGRLGDTRVRNNIALDAEGFVARYDKRDTDDPSLQYVEAGVLAFHRDLLPLIPEGVVSLEQQIYPLLISRRQLAAYPTTQRFYDIGTPERLRIIEDYLSQ
ncbi:MAG: sugar phosphate nucleotidyltransferase [Candidatus Solibacter sp.]